MDHIKRAIRDVPDFPKPGILFKDITPILQDAALFRDVIEAFATRYADREVDLIAAMESRGFIFAAPLAVRLGAGFVPLRKHGKLPWRTRSERFHLEYGEETLEIHEDAVAPGTRVLILDDVLATGGTAAASVSLVRACGGTVVESGFVIELGFLGGREKLKAVDVHSLIVF